MNERADKSVLITGASRGIGKACAKLFAANGYSLYLVCHTNIEELELLALNLFESYRIPCRCFCGDIGNPEFISSVFNDISSINILINNVGIAYYGLIQDMSAEDWQKMLNTNLSSAFYTSKWAIPIMLKQGDGRIINVSSVWGNVGASTEVAYSASKGGLNAFTKALAKELAPSHIPVNAVAFGCIDTDMNRHLDEDEVAALCEEIPFGRMATPDEAAKMIFGIATMPEYLTGQIITFDGGWIG